MDKDTVVDLEIENDRTKMFINGADVVGLKSIDSIESIPFGGYEIKITLFVDDIRTKINGTTFEMPIPVKP